MHRTLIILVILLIKLMNTLNTTLLCQMKNKLIMFPWVGILKVHQGSTQALTRLILIGDHKAIGNAIEISKLDKITLRKSSTAIFCENNTVWNCQVHDYLLHPEFHDKIFNTIAILNLNSTRKKWFPIHMPINNNYKDQMYAVGFTDQNKDLELSVFRMLPVNERRCSDFYKNEGLDFRTYWPKHLLCYKGEDVQGQCVFDSGMALVAKLRGKWILFGLGILGPGCNLPSRYIQLLPYVPWFNLHILGKPKSLRRQYRIRSDNNKTAIDPSKDIVSESHNAADDFYVHRLNDNAMIMWDAYANVKEEVYGDCISSKPGALMYRDAGIIQTTGQFGTGVYALSLYDLRYYGITCITVTVKCSSRSITKFWYEKGFREDLSRYIKTIPHPNKNLEVPPKILFLKDDYYQYENITTANIVFMFEFYMEATINVDFYGNKIVTTNTKTLKP